MPEQTPDVVLDTDKEELEGASTEPVEREEHYEFHE
jgi:hypothetical protein